MQIMNTLRCLLTGWFCVTVTMAAWAEEPAASAPPLAEAVALCLA